MPGILFLLLRRVTRRGGSRFGQKSACAVCTYERRKKAVSVSRARAPMSQAAEGNERRERARWGTVLRPRLFLQPLGAGPWRERRVQARRTHRDRDVNHQWRQLPRRLSPSGRCSRGDSSTRLKAHSQDTPLHRTHCFLRAINSLSPSLPLSLSLSLQLENTRVVACFL